MQTTSQQTTSELIEDVKQTLEKKGIKRCFLAKKLRISKGHLSNILSGRSSLTDKLSAELTEFISK